MFSDLLRRVVEEYPDPHAAWIVNVVDCAKHIFYLFVLSICILLSVCTITTFIIWFLLKYMMNQERVYKWSVGTNTCTKTWSKSILEELMMSEKYVAGQLQTAWSSPPLEISSAASGSISFPVLASNEESAVLFTLVNVSLSLNWKHCLLVLVFLL